MIKYFTTPNSEITPLHFNNLTQHIFSKIIFPLAKLYDLKYHHVRKRKRSKITKYHEYGLPLGGETLVRSIPENINYFFRML